MVIHTVGELKAIIKDLDDEMPVRGMNDEIPLVFVADYEDVPENRPPPTLVIEV